MYIRITKIFAVSKFHSSFHYKIFPFHVRCVNFVNEWCSRGALSRNPTARRVKIWKDESLSTVSVKPSRTFLRD